MLQRGIRYGKRIARQLRRQAAPAGIILLYHRVAELSSDPQMLSVNPSHFAQHLEVLKRNYQPMSLQAMAQAVQNNTLPRHGVAITFDDGYADNLQNAKPLLAQQDMRATVFVATGNLGTRQEFYWDALERLLLQPDVDWPNTLSLTVAGQQYEWRLDLTPGHKQNTQNMQWNLLCQDDPTAQHKLYRTLCPLLKPLTAGEQVRLIAELRSQVHLAPGEHDTHRSLSEAEVQALAEGGLVEIGAHTVHHVMLSALPVTEQSREIGASKQHLEEILGKPVQTFSYPYGAAHDYTAETVIAVQNSGFVAACANQPRVVEAGVDRLQLPRFLVRDWDGDEFAQQLQRFWGA